MCTASLVSGWSATSAHVFWVSVSRESGNWRSSFETRLMLFWRRQYRIYVYVYGLVLESNISNIEKKTLVNSFLQRIFFREAARHKTLFDNIFRILFSFSKVDRSIVKTEGWRRSPGTPQRSFPIWYNFEFLIALLSFLFLNSCATRLNWVNRARRHRRLTYENRPTSTRHNKNVASRYASVMNLLWVSILALCKIITKDTRIEY